MSRPNGYASPLLDYDFIVNVILTIVKIKISNKIKTIQAIIHHIRAREGRSDGELGRWLGNWGWRWVDVSGLTFVLGSVWG